MARKLGYLVCGINTNFVPELLFEVSENNEIFYGFVWLDENKNKWKIKKGHLSEYEFEIGDDVYDGCSDILGIYDLENKEHLNKMIHRAFHQQMNLEDLHLYE